ncbi:threonine synthase [Candidatus Geothermarchaeota archaeon ex4572_27]|nr:MAG: threonine synthase [Candidatus Geothermarchaeota archaeon ex4572_27]
MSPEALIDPSMRSMWRFRAVLPFGKAPLTMGEGGTPMHKARRLDRHLGVKAKIYLKNETMNPTGSFLDRGVSAALTHALSEGYERVALVSTGNLGASAAAYSARAGIKALIFIPSSVDMGKLYQTLVFGPDVRVVDDLESAYAEVERLAGEGYYPLLPNNPYFLEGVKTIGYEIAEAMGWRSPDAVVVPMGHGGTIFAVWKAFVELEEAGIIDGVPRMIGVQLRGASPIADRILGQDNARPNGVISDIAVRNPLNRDLAVMAIRRSGGTAVRVDYESVIRAVRAVAELEGIYVEAAAASTVAALSAMGGELDGCRVVCVLTGMGLKDPVVSRELTRAARYRLGLLEEPEAVYVGRTKLRILRAIAEGHDYGYAIWRRLGEVGVRIRLPTVYQHLSELARMGLIREAGREGLGRPTVRYMLTDKGRRMLEYLGGR